MKCSVGSSTWMTLQPRGGELAQLAVHRLGHVPDQLLLVVEIVVGRVAVQEERQHLRRAGAELHRLAGSHRGLLRDAPDLGVLERVLRIVLHLADHARPAPRLVDRVQHRADGIGEQRRAGLLGLQFLVLEALPPLQHVVVPRAARHVLVEVVVAGGEDVEPGAQLVGDDDGVRVGELLAIPRVHHGGVERAAHMFTLYQRGRGQEPVTVAGSIRSLVAVNAMSLSFLGCGLLRPGVRKIRSKDVKRNWPRHIREVHGQTYV